MEYVEPPLFATWQGAVDHEGHTITLIEKWPPRIDDARVEFEKGGIVVSNGVESCGRVRCECGQEWNIGGFPFEFKPCP